ncbi:TcpQ domain-containing protein [Colwellia psychrerythraea]|uniref:Toxin co-regulated pilus biosynthesis protein Q n=1 Tax=Colwellia psychrerythraea TaxID=28229 RepID=A0A099L0Y1_COLPS|nr:TcpQ domain-containing protein [Colwellia psychrerythraea]KGJ95533.1 Toxin co-regulated pilus biosynthesis protein Q [Colwellia psychrerythraea]
MNFWLRNTILGVFLAVLAWLFFANQDFLLSLDGSLGNVEDSTVKTTETVVDAVPKEVEVESKTTLYQQGRSSSNPAAVGLSKFYANLHGDMGGNGPKIRNNIVYLPDPKGDLAKILQAREMIVRPYNKNWQGSIESRPFRKGETLNQKLVEYSEKDGIELIWWLNRDYVVKDPFRIEKDILQTTYQVAKAIEGHFESGLSIFFCHRQRAIVVIESAPQLFLDEECISLASENPY